MTAPGQLRPLSCWLRWPRRASNRLTGNLTGTSERTALVEFERPWSGGGEFSLVKGGFQGCEWTPVGPLASLDTQEVRRFDSCTPHPSDARSRHFSGAGVWR